MARSRLVVTSFLCSAGARKQGRLGRPLGRCLRIFWMRDSPTTRVRVSRLFDPSWCRNPLGKTQDGPSRGYEFRTDAFMARRLQDPIPSVRTLLQRGARWGRICSSGLACSACGRVPSSVAVLLIDQAASRRTTGPRVSWPYPCRFGHTYEESRRSRLSPINPIFQGRMGQRAGSFPEFLARTRPH